MDMLTQERLKELLTYNPVSGVFIRNTNIHTARIGDVTGSINELGYVDIYLDGKKYKSHRLVWLYVFGVFPKNEIDHIDHNKTNNAIANLREVTASGNQQNQIKARKNNLSTGVLGVSFKKRDQVYTARITTNYVYKHIGTFKTVEEASDAYIKAKRELHPTCTL